MATSPLRPRLPAVFANATRCHPPELLPPYAAPKDCSTSKPAATRATATRTRAAVNRYADEDGLEVAEAIGDRLVSRECRLPLGCTRMWQGDLVGAIAQFDEVAAEANADRDVVWTRGFIDDRVHALACHGDTAAATAAANASIRGASEVFGWYEYNPGESNALVVAAHAAGDAAAQRVSARRLSSTLRGWSVRG